jgi:hypothetical protein
MPQTHCGFVDDPGAGVSGPLLLVTYGPTIQVDIGFDPLFKANPNASVPTPKPAITGQHALVDSGASECCIDSLLAAQLNLPVVDRRPISGIHGKEEVNIHLAQIYVPSLGHIMYGRFAGVHLAAGGQVHRAILGRTFLKYFRMSYNGATGEVILSN